MLKRILLICQFYIVFCFLCTSLKASDIVIYSSANSLINVSDKTFYLEDKEKKLSISDVLNSNSFKANLQKNINLGISSSAFWLSLKIKNTSNDSVLNLELSQPLIDEVDFFSVSDLGVITEKKEGLIFPFREREYNHQNYIFKIKIAKDKTAKIFLRFRSNFPITIPLFLGSENSVYDSLLKKDILFGLLFGIILAMFLYNIFVYTSLKDSTYLYYVFYIFFLVLSQSTLQGYSFKYLWPNSTWLLTHSVLLFTNLGGIFAIAFTQRFLQIKKFTPKLNLIYNVLIGTFAISLLLSFINLNIGAFIIMQVSTSLSAILGVFIAIYILNEGYAPAKFFLIAWLSLIFGVLIFILKDYEILPVNNLTANSLIFGSAAETILLSFALANKINIYKKEREEFQLQALEQAKENEQLVRDQNIVLEQKVGQRTHELKVTNTQLNVALDNLKDAQTQLVEAEKMASLGQLTAGIAHEINNPINFVKSNINPLRLDVNDLVDVLNEYEHLHNLKEEATYRKKLSDIEKFKNQIDVKFVQNEINSLIVGIEEGAQRTAEIVQGLRTFSRIDEAELKTVNIHDGILSTLVILKNSTPFYIKIEKQFNAKGNVECYPGKLNQVFMNIITNAVQAIKAKSEKSEEEKITIFTKDIENDCIQISVKDTGIGMTEETKHRVFEPFFTTKDVGEGTGLGMAIVFKIIQKHEGKIDIISKPFEGSEFILTLPYKHPISDHL